METPPGFWLTFKGSATIAGLGDTLFTLAILYKHEALLRETSQLRAVLEEMTLTYTTHSDSEGPVHTDVLCVRSGGGADGQHYTLEGADCPAKADPLNFLPHEVREALSTATIEHQMLPTPASADAFLQ